MPAEPNNSGSLCPQIYAISPSEALVPFAINFGPKLGSGITLSGTPSLTVTPTGPTLGNQQINSSAMVVDGITCPVNTVALFTVTGCTVDTDYEIHVTCATTGGATRDARITLPCRL
jgi:hypothetical protein